MNGTKRADVIGRPETGVAGQRLQKELRVLVETSLSGDVMTTLAVWHGDEICTRG